MILGDYNSEIRKKNGHVDNHKLLKKLKELNVNTYLYLIWHNDMDWWDFKEFLELSKDRKWLENVWAVICPPSESPILDSDTPFSEPYRLDFITWTREFNKLSRKYKKFNGYVIDDFLNGKNRKLFTPTYMYEMKQARSKRLKFYPVIYFIPDEMFQLKLTPIGLYDGIIYPHFYFRSTTQLLYAEIQFMKTAFTNIGTTHPLYSMPYLEPFGNAVLELNETIGEYMDVMYKNTDGIVAYCTPKDKLNIDSRKSRFELVKNKFKEFKKQ